MIYIIHHYSKLHPNATTLTLYLSHTHVVVIVHLGLSYRITVN